MTGTPHRCPVCGGAGVLPVASMTTNMATRPCHPCNGTGIVWSPDSTLTFGRIDEITDLERRVRALEDRKP